MDSITLVDLHKICRFCLNLTNEIVSIFSSSIIFMVKKLDIIKLELDYNMPTSICQSCVYRLVESYNFRQQIETSECRLRDFISHHNVTSTISQFPYSINSTDRIDDNSASFVSPHFSSTVNQFSLPPPPPPLSQHYDTTFSEMNNMCDIFESNNSEDIDVDVSSLTRSEEDEDTIQDKILEIEEENQNKIIVDFPETLSYIESSDFLKNATDSSKEFKNSPNVNTKQKNKPPRHRKLRPECPDCGKTCASASHLEIHQRTHNGVKPFNCEICHKSFTQIGNFTLHMRIHKGEKKYQCEICSKLFTTSSNLKAHISAHTDERKYKCLKCDRLFKVKIQLNRHIATHSIKEFQCNLCEKLFLTKTYLRVHTENVHEKKRKFKCTDCDQRFSSSSNWKMHCRIHTGEKPFACKFCLSKFNQSSSLARHMKTHANNLQFKSNTENKTETVKKNSPVKDSDLATSDNSHSNIIITDYVPNEIIDSTSPISKNIELWDDFVEKENII